MTTVRSAPFLRILPSRVVPGPWTDAASGAALASRGLDGWDPTTDIRLERELTIDLDRARVDAGLTDGEHITCAATWYCPTTTLRGVGTRVELGDGSAQIRLAVALPGSELGGRVELRTIVALADGGLGRRPLAAQIPGSVIWEDSTTVALEGAGSRFPMEWLDFASASWLPSGAGWYLDWTPDAPEAPALGAIRLYLNSGHEAVRRAVIGNPPMPEDQVIRDVIEFDVARSLILGALRTEPGPWDAAVLVDGTVAAVVSRLIGVAFPAETIDGLRNRLRAAPERLEVRIQDGLRLFHDLARG